VDSETPDRVYARAIRLKRFHPTAPVPGHAGSRFISDKVSSVNKRPDYKTEPSTSGELRETIPDALAGHRVDQALAILFPDYSRNRLQQWIREGHVIIDGAPCTGKSRVHGGESVLLRVQAQAEELAFRPEDIALNVVYEDRSILVVDKPAGLVVHPGSGNWSGTLLNALLRHAPSTAAVPRAGIVHRLDKDTSGLLVVAKTLPAQTDLVRQMQARTVTREYAAIVHGVIGTDGTVDAPLGRHPRDRKRMAVIASGKTATTHFSVVERGAGWTLLTCRLETGRTHQIRVHLSSIGHALIGDPLYKSRAVAEDLAQAAREFGRQALHAQRLQIRHPESGETVQWHSPLPNDLTELLNGLRNG
jgi:23S rRNA pseudouridine1911/1915/1917 synthase